MKGEFETFGEFQNLIISFVHAKKPYEIRRNIHNDWVGCTYVTSWSFSRLSQVYYPKFIQAILFPPAGSEAAKWLNTISLIEFKEHFGKFGTEIFPTTEIGMQFSCFHKDHYKRIEETFSNVVREVASVHFDCSYLFNAHSDVVSEEYNNSIGESRLNPEESPAKHKKRRNRRKKRRTQSLADLLLSRTEFESDQDVSKSDFVPRTTLEMYIHNMDHDTYTRLLEVFTHNIDNHLVIPRYY